MKVILLKDTPKVGVKNDIVEVSDGYAQNVLFPQQRAERATPEKVAHILKAKKDADTAQSERVQRIRKTIEELGSIQIAAKANASGNLFEAITDKRIRAELDARTIALTDKELHLSKPIKHTGNATVDVHVGNWKGVLTIEVVAV